MPLQNRVLPTGEIVAAAWRGGLTGNRGHFDFDADGQLGRRRWADQAWISCELTHPRGKVRTPNPKAGWTPLFFYDEACALAAGHRPCGYCRREAYEAFKVAWGARTVGEMDRALHAARVDRQRRQVRFTARATDLPDGVFVLIDDRPALKSRDCLHVWTPAGYEPGNTLPALPVTVLTPDPILNVLRAGYTPHRQESLVND